MLSDKQKLALNLLVYKGKLKKDVAAQIGVIPGTISEWFRNEEFLSEHDKMLRALHQEMAAKATERLAKLINDEQSSTALGAVKLSLSIAGYDAPVKQEIKAEGLAIKIEYDKE